MTEFLSYPWDDITPIPQDEGPDPVVQIAYASDFVEQMNLFRALIAKKEYSLRAFRLTDSLLELNPASYTVWQFRRECIRALKPNLTLELDFMDTFASENPKNYQIWYHRRCVVEMMGDASRELAFCGEVYEVDAKNYHAWAHRQWVLTAYGLWDKELDFTATCIEEDVRNNSAWNHRWFVVHSGPEPITPEVLAWEVAFTMACISKVKKNESSWNYLRGLARAHLELKASITEQCEELVKSTEGHNYLALGLLADLRESENTPEALQRAQALMERLIEVDKIRSKSWVRRLAKVLHELGK